jgi:hypothetical protein
VFPEGLLDWSFAPTDVRSLEQIFRSMPEDRLYVRVPGVTPDSGPPKRIRMDEIDDVSQRLRGPEPLHLQAIDLHRFDAGFAELLARFTCRLAALVPELARHPSRCSTGLFLSTPGVVVPFHADTEHNFLCQVVGDKQMHLWDRTDLSIFSSPHRERLVCDDIHVLDTYRPELEKEATIVHLRPGTVVYHPPMAPHWVATGKSDYSLSITVSFITPSVDALVLVHKLNSRLRRLGLNPSPVGHSAAGDQVKLLAARGLRGVLRLARAYSLH